MKRCKAGILLICFISALLCGCANARDVNSSQVEGTTAVSDEDRSSTRKTGSSDEMVETTSSESKTTTTKRETTTEGTEKTRTTSADTEVTTTTSITTKVVTSTCVETTATTVMGTTPSVGTTSTSSTTKESMTNPPMPGQELINPPMPGQELINPPMPGQELINPPMPGQELVNPPMPGQELVNPPMPGQELVNPPMPEQEVNNNEEEMAYEEISDEKLEELYLQHQKLLMELNGWTEETQTETATVPIVPPTVVNVINELPQEMQDVVDYYKRMYPGIKIGVGLYSLDGCRGYEYNAGTKISSACTVKAPYAMYVCSRCEELGIDIWTEKLTYNKSKHFNDGSGTIKNSSDGSKYSIGYLLRVMLDLSDNTAYNILVSRFSLSGYQQFLNQFGGQQMYGRQYGQATVRERRAEWVQIWNYVNGGTTYAQTLYDDLYGTKYCYIVKWMKKYHTYLHKSGWSYGSYTSASDCAIIDSSYMLIVLTEDTKTEDAHTDVVKAIGAATESFINRNDGVIF